jgi:hypothetical protein
MDDPIVELSLKCPIGLDNTRDICSAGTCAYCQIERLKAERDEWRDKWIALARAASIISTL